MTAPRLMRVRWPYNDIPDPGAPVRFGRRLIGHVTAVHQPADPSDDTTLEITLTDDPGDEVIGTTMKGLVLDAGE